MRENQQSFDIVPASGKGIPAWSKFYTTDGSFLWKACEVKDYFPNEGWLNEWADVNKTSHYAFHYKK